VLGHLNHIASVIVNANPSIIRPAAVFGIVDGIRRIRVPQAAKWQNVTDQINAPLSLPGRTSSTCCELVIENGQWLAASVALMFHPDRV